MMSTGLDLSLDLLNDNAHIVIPTYLYLGYKFSRSCLQVRFGLTLIMKHFLIASKGILNTGR